jgi:hypothetical protein
LQWSKGEQVKIKDEFTVLYAVISLTLQKLVLDKTPLFIEVCRRFEFEFTSYKLGDAAFGKG